MKIKINKLKLFGYHGVYDKEKSDGQDFEIDISFKITTSKMKDDKLDSTIDYTEVMDGVVSVFNSKRYNLLESIIDDMFICIFSNKRIKSAKVSIKKVNPPINLDFESIEVKDERKND